MDNPLQVVIVLHSGFGHNFGAITLPEPWHEKSELFTHIP